MITDFLKNIVDSCTPLIIIIDGIDLLDEEDKSIFLHHLVEEFEDKDTHSKIIITAREKEHQFKVNQKLVPLIEEKKQELIEQYMLEYGKKLPRKAVDYIATHDSSSNLYFLTILLNEIRLLDNFDTLGSNIQYYLESTNTVELFEKIFFRFKLDYSGVPTVEVLSFLYLVRDGLSEDELLDILNYISQDVVFTRLEFSSLFLALEPYLTNNDGLYRLTNNYFREVINMCLLIEEKENKLRTDLAHFFWDQNDSFENDKRAVRETIYQVYKTGDIFEVVEFLLIPMTFINLIFFDRDMLWKYIMDINRLNNAQWNYLNEIHSKVMEEDYNPAILRLVAVFFSFDLGAKDYALDILHKVERILIENGDTDTERLAECYRDMADSYQYNARKWGDKDAKALSKKYAKKASEYANNSPLVLASQYYMEAKDFQYSGKFKEKGLEKYVQSIKLKEKALGELDEQVISDYRNLGNICRQEGLYTEADQSFTIAWERSKTHYGELSEETYLAGRNIVELYFTHAKPIKSMEDFIEEIQKEHGEMSEESLKNLEEYYVDMPGWEGENYKKLLEVSKLMLKSASTYEKEIDSRLYTYVAQAYRGIDDMENYQKYIKLSEENK